MTISPEPGGLPSPQPPPCADLSPGHAEAHGKRHGLTRLADHVLTNWVHTVRLLVVLAVVIGMITLALWLLRVDLHLGPLHITRPVS